jgi:hypothetical protein
MSPQAQHWMNHPQGDGAVSRRRGRQTRTARLDVSYDARVYAADSHGGWESAPGTRDRRGSASLPKYHGGGVKPEGLSLAQSY